MHTPAKDYNFPN